MSISRKEALQYIGYCLDDSLNRIDTDGVVVRIPDNAVLIGWQTGFEPVFVAVWSYLPDTTLSRESAIDIAVDYLQEIKWFANYGDDNSDNSLIAPDYVIGGSDD